MAKRDLTKIEPDDATAPLPSKRRSMSDIKSMMGAAATRGQPADRYESVRPYGFESSIQRAKDTAVGSGARGAGTVAKELAKSAVPGGALLGSPKEVERGVEEVKSAVGKYRGASAAEDAAERELEAQNRREMRGTEEYCGGGKVKKYAKGGAVSSASRRADGIAKRGKTRGKMV